MPLGISSAPEVFQRQMHQFAEGLSRVEVIHDDFTVVGCGKTYEEDLKKHENILRGLLLRYQDQHVTLGKDKVKLHVKAVTYLGHRFTNEGLKPDPDKVRAITEMPTPVNAEAVRRFIGMIESLQKFLSKFSEVAKPLRDLVCKDVQFCWESSHEEAVQKMKELVVSTPVLQYCMSKEVTIEADASKDGLGAVLLQEEKPVAYASRALTAAETRYAQIGKELLAIVFVCEKFHVYIYGRLKMIVKSDHKPLEMIFQCDYRG